MDDYRFLIYVVEQGESLEVSFVDLSNGDSLLAIWVADAPLEMLEVQCMVYDIVLIRIDI